ncbi:PilZ domain-containing protein [Mesorhizobium loti]|uniref:PilZ domain-containing protein n=1 Tax=Rhizobium loti TaxID=381 RepID=UPI0009E49B1A|nr:PilZ domain-containing protein [Mesorhizobium loti]
MTADDPPIERRSHVRPTVLKEGTINGENVSIGCTIRNQHAHGAELRVDPEAVIPHTFVLHVPADGASYRAAVRWRRKERLGVQLYASGVR